jgi:hypothetical protein
MGNGDALSPDGSVFDRIVCAILEGVSAQACMGIFLERERERERSKMGLLTIYFMLPVASQRPCNDGKSS